jgi:hypothetical protein
MITPALDLAKRLPVFPCDNDKRPFTAHGFKDARALLLISFDYSPRLRSCPYR